MRLALDRQPQSRGRRVLMPMIILVVAVCIGWWSGWMRTNENQGLAEGVHVAVQQICEHDAGPMPIAWALPILRETFADAVGGWCEHGIDLASITVLVSQPAAGEDWRVVTVSAMPVSSLDLEVIFVSGETPMVRAVRINTDL